MVNETAIVVRKPITPEMWKMVQSIAPVTAASRMFRVNEQQAAVVMLMGHELGLGLASAFEFIHVIDGKPSLSPKGALALIQRSGLLESLEIVDKVDEKDNPVSCTVTMKRKGGFEYTSTFSMSDAKRAGIAKSKSAWEAYPANMLRWRAIGYCADVAFPDVTGGLYRPEELGADVDENGEPVKTWQVEQPIVTMTQLPEVTEKVVVVKVEPETVIEQVVEQTEPPKEEKPGEKAPVLSDLIGKYGAQAILEANDGLIPQTDEQLRAVAEKLGDGDNAS